MVTTSEFVAALDAFRSALTPVAVTPMPPLLVTDGMRIAVADGMIDCTACLATLSQDAQPELHAMTKASLDARMQLYTVWTAAVPLATLSPALSHSGARSQPGFPPCQAAGRYRIATMAALSDESEKQKPCYSDSLLSDLTVSLPAAVVHLSSAEVTLLVSLSALSPVYVE